jgi:hypothetical protein
MGMKSNGIETSGPDRNRRRKGLHLATRLGYLSTNIIKEGFHEVTTDVRIYVDDEWNTLVHGRLIPGATRRIPHRNPDR